MPGPRKRTDAWTITKHAEVYQLLKNARENLNAASELLFDRYPRNSAIIQKGSEALHGLQTLQYIHQTYAGCEGHPPVKLAAYNEQFEDTTSKGSREPFRIPVMDIQDFAIELRKNPVLRSLKGWLNDLVEAKREDWEIEGAGYWVESDLERQWYPIFVIENRWLANAFTRKINELFTKETPADHVDVILELTEVVGEGRKEAPGEKSFDEFKKRCPWRTHWSGGLYMCLHSTATDRGSHECLKEYCGIWALTEYLGS